MTQDYLRCPVCRAALSPDAVGRSLLCPSGHCFDIAASGYVNLTRGGAAAASGDAKEMIRARRNFLAAGYYLPVANALTTAVCSRAPHTVFDAGCGEGYYTSALARALPDAQFCGFDLSKPGIELAARAARVQGIEHLHYAVAGIFDLPVADACADLVVNFFAPCAGAEFSRVLRSGGHLILGVAAPRHLFGLKQLLYDTPYENELRRDEIPGFVPEDVIEVRCTAEIPREHILPLFAMTPYYFRTSPSDQEKLTQVDSLVTEIAVDLLIYRKAE